MKRLILLFTFLVSPVFAHEMPIGKATATIGDSGDLSLRWELDLISYAMGNTPEVTAADLRKRFAELTPAQRQQRLNAAAAQLAEGLEIRGDRERVKFSEVIAPSAETITGDGIVTLRGASATGTMRFRFPKESGPVVLTLESKDSVLFQQLLLAGEESPEVTTGAVVVSDPIATGWRYLVLGFEHILPLGLDHILFVLGLFLLNPGVRPLLLQITTFTVAHSITLALSMTGAFSLPGEIVEPVIAASIVFVAMENILVKKLHAWRLVVVFFFGLVHGLGFAGVLQELGIPRDQFAVALVSFNVGVEFGQLSVVALALLATSWSLRSDWYRARVAIPASLLIASVGAYWTIERLA